MFTYYLTENMHVESLQFTAEAPSQDNLHLPLRRQGRPLPVLKFVVSVTTPYLFTSEVHAEGPETVPLPWWQFLSLLPGKVLTPRAGSPQRWTWTSHLWARTTFLETLVIRTETLLGHYSRGKPMWTEDFQDDMLLAMCSASQMDCYILFYLEHI